MELIGVDIGGSHISAVKVILTDRVASFDCFQEADVDTYGDKESIITAWVEVIRKASGKSTNYKVGIAMPGP